MTGPGDARTAGPGVRPSGAAARWALLLTVFLASLAPFLPALRQGFVELDDDRNFLLNESYRGLGRENLEWMFSTGYMGHYQPLSWLTLALDYQLYGLDGAGYHGTNMLLHGLGMVALYFLALALLRPSFAGVPDLRLRLAAAGAALLHGMHPLRVESVAWATERRDVQSGLFLILTVLAYVAWTRSEPRQGRLLALSLLCFSISLLSKAWGITLPAVLLVLDVWPLRRLAKGVGWKRLLAEKAVFAVPALVVAGLAAWAQGEAAARETLADHTLLERCVQACYGLFFYLWKTIWPTGLSALYWLEMELDPLRPVHVVAYAVVGTVTLALVWNRQRFPAGLTAWGIYALVASPVLGFLQSGFQKVADRYTYLACVPFALLFGAGLARLGRRGAGFVPALAATAALLAVLGALSWKQTLTWRDSETLYERVVAIEPGNYFGWHNLAVVYHKQGRYEQAIAAELRSIEHHPGKGNVLARTNLATLLRLVGRQDEVPAVWRGILAVDPTNLDALRGLKNDCLRRGDRAGALALVEEAVSRAPEFVDGYAELAGLHALEGRLERALEVWDRAARAAPASARARHGVGATLLQMGRDQDAGVWLEQAFGMDNRDVEIAVDFARVLGRTGRLAQASELLRQVLAVAPGHARALAAQRALEAGQRP